MKIRLNIDTRGYTEKPSKQAAAISNRTRCAKGQKEIEPAELIKLIEKGYTFTPAAIGGTLEEIQKQGLTLYGVLPHSDDIYQCDCDGTPSSKLPSTNPTKQALKSVLQSLGL